MSGGDRERIEAAYLATLGRRPAADEVDELLSYMSSFEKKTASDKWQSFCRILMSSNEFIYVD